MSTSTATGGKRTYPNQINCAEAIVATFARKEEMYVLLRAQMQSGKTGTFHRVARLMLEHHMVDRVYVISGSNDIVLRNQAKEDAIAFNPDMTAQIKVIFRQDFEKRGKPMTMVLERTLIIVEESHLDQSLGQKMDKFLARHGLSLNGTTEEMCTNDTFILSVSATPFSEQSGIAHGLAIGKIIEDLEPDVGYRGVKLFLENECIHPNFGLFSQTQRLIDLILGHGNKWNLVRCLDTTKLDVIRKAATAAGIECKLYTQDKDIDIDDLEAAPTKPTIVFLKGLLRCGKVVPKSHIGLVWEDSINVRADTVLQSLLGRMCGYYAPDADWPQIYLSSKILKADKATGLNQLERYIAGMESVDNIMPTLGANLKGARDIQIKERMPVCPIRLGPFTRHEVVEMGLPTTVGPTGGKINQRMVRGYNPLYSGLDVDIMRIVRASTEYTAEQKSEIQDIIDSHETPRWREWADGPIHHSPAHFHAAVTATLRGEACVERTGDDALTLAFVTGSVAFPEEKFCIYVLFQLNSHGQEAALDQRIAKTTHKEIFAKVAVPAPRTSVMAMGVTMTDAVLTSPAAFETQLGHMLEIWSTASELHVTNCITEIAENHLSFNKAAFGFGTADNKFKAILERLQTRFSITLTPKYSAATKHDKTLFRLISLSWA